MATASGGAWAYLALKLKSSAELTALVSGRIFRECAPEGSTAAPTLYPLVVCSFSSSRSVLGTGAERLASEPLYLVRAIVDNRDQATLAAAANAIDAALSATTEPQAVSFAGADYLVQCWWERDYERAEFDQGVRFDSAGGFWRLFIVSAD